MDGRKIFDSINICDDIFIEKVVLDMENRRKKQERLRRLFFDKNQHLSGIRIAAAIAGGARRHLAPIQFEASATILSLYENKSKKWNVYFQTGYGDGSTTGAEDIR